MLIPKPRTGANTGAAAEAQGEETSEADKAELALILDLLQKQSPLLAAMQMQATLKMARAMEDIADGLNDIVDELRKDP